MFSKSLFSVTLAVATGYCALAQIPDDPDGRAMIQGAEQMVTAYHAGQPASPARLRVVYFVAHDREPLPGYAERLDRVVKDVSEYYRDGLRRFGVETKGLPIEEQDGHLLIHLVRGKELSSAYHYDSGNETRAEIGAALKDSMDVERECVLAFYGLCEKQTDGRYIFNSPYYGYGSQAGGFCHAADCELLDPKLLGETKQKMVFTEHYYPRVEKTIAGFNSMYLGGVAHELGHGLGLPHDSASAAEPPKGDSLMGFGNLSYRQDVWGGGPPAFLSRGSALRLISHPFFTGSNRGRWEASAGRFDALQFSGDPEHLRIKGRVSGEIAPYAVIASIWPMTARTDHGARTSISLVKDGAFALEASGLAAGRYHLKLESLHVNGAAQTRELRLDCGADGAPDIAALDGDWITEFAEAAVRAGKPDARALVSDEAIAAAPTPEAQKKLSVLRQIFDPAAPIALATAPGDSAFLSDGIWTEAKVGWGAPTRNTYWLGENQTNDVFLELHGRFYDKGLYAHSPSRYLFPLGGKWKTFTATIGLRDGAADVGSAIFVVRGDGKEIYRSPMLRVGAREEVNAKIADVQTLELQTLPGEDHNHCSWAIWVDPKVAR